MRMFTCLLNQLSLFNAILTVATLSIVLLIVVVLGAMVLTNDHTRLNSFYTVDHTVLSVFNSD
jgi:hypothetical protein